MIESTEKGSTEFLRKFGYRRYEGSVTGRKSRIFSLVIFEVKSTWHRSTFGKVLLIILMVINFITLTVTVGSSQQIITDLEGQQKKVIRDALNRFVANYISFRGDYIRSGTHETGLRMNPPVAILLIALVAIAGSGFFADDRAGKTIEIWLSRLQKREYVIGKIAAILIYINLFLMIPILVVGALNVQAIKETSHLEQWDYYLGIIIYSLIASLIMGLAILSFSISVEKRQYASLGFFLVFILGTVFVQLLIIQDRTNEFLLLLSPTHFLVLLAYVSLGDFSLGIGDGRPEEFLLDDGSGLEYYHVIGTAIMLIISMACFLAFKINRLTTEEL